MGVEPLEDDDPAVIGAIPLVGRLGAGGMGRVYLGVHRGRYAAVKQLLPSVVAEDRDFLRRFGQELDNLSRLPAEATAPLLDSDRTAVPPWFATAYVPGLTLREAVDVNGGPLPVDALWLLLREAASSLAVVHGQDGMVHRDVKPSNVMLTLDGLTLIDFGVARAAEQSQLTRTGMVVGTPAYMSPEQASARRELSAAVDVFALGSVVAYAASGQPPFGDESGHGVLYRIVHEEPDLKAVRDLDPGLADVVAACLAKDPEARPTAAELLELASLHGPFEPPLWPEAITVRLSERAAFATNVPVMPEVPRVAEPEVVVVPPDREREPEPKPTRRRKDRRTHVLLVAVPVVISVTTVAFQLLPYVTDSRGDRDGTAGTPGASRSAAVPGPAEPAAHRASASPTGPPSSTASQKSKDQGKSGKTVVGGAGQNSGSGSSNATGSSTGDSARATTPTRSGSSGSFTLKNGEDGKCLIQVYGAAGLGSCSDSTAKWTFPSASGGTVKVRNVSSGSCLTANGQGVYIGDCSAAGTAHLWKTGSGNTIATPNNTCLDITSDIEVVLNACAPGTASQGWARG